MSLGNILSIFILEAAVNDTTNVLKHCDGKKVFKKIELGAHLFALS